jgi:carboxyl-terminal processing protease
LRERRAGQLFEASARAADEAVLALGVLGAARRFRAAEHAPRDRSDSPDERDPENASHAPILSRAPAGLQAYPAAVLRCLAPFMLALAAGGCASAQVGSVGAVLGVDGESGSVFVRETREGLAADKAGLHPGDEVLMIDGVYARDLGAAAVREKLRGAPGSTVDLTIVRGEEVLRVKVTRAPLGAPAAPPPPKEERIAP